VENLAPQGWAIAATIKIWGKEKTFRERSFEKEIFWGRFQSKVPHEDAMVKRILRIYGFLRSKRA
jgi:hypothetical protein